MEIGKYVYCLYKKYLYEIISKDEFAELKYYLNKMSKDELSELLKEEWNENIIIEKMDDKTKKDCKTRLNFYIENKKSKLHNKNLLYYIAAVILIIILNVSFICFFFPARDPSIFVASVDKGNKALITLPDKSNVWLNSNTKLMYKNDNGIRKVKLNGEAFFKVAKNVKNPFIVHVNGLEIEVLGTSFNIKARANNIETSLVEGSVKLSSSKLLKSYYLKPNEKAIYSDQSNKIKIISTNNIEETAWLNSILVFKSKKFIDVLKILEDWYEVNIICKYSEIENDRISGMFENESLDFILQTFKIQYDIDYIKDKDSVIIKKRS